MWPEGGARVLCEKSAAEFDSNTVIINIYIK